MPDLQRPRTWGWLILFASMPTLLCCALPILLVSLGMGAVVASVYGEYFPFLRWFGLHEETTFGVTSLILLAAGLALYRPGRACPSDQELARQCESAHRWNVRLYWTSVLIWCVGFSAAYVPPLFQ